MFKLKLYSKQIRILLLIVLLVILNNLFYKSMTFNNTRYVYYLDKNNQVEQLSDDKIMKDMAILIPSCDVYSELWEINTKFLLKSWPSLVNKYNSIPIYLMSNHEPFVNSRVINLKLGDDVSWSDNLIKALSQIDKKYVLIILDDYIMNREVDEKRFIEAYRLFLRYNAPYMGFAAQSAGYYDGPLLTESVMIKNRAGHYRNSTQVSIWQKKDLLYVLKAGESAWDFEIRGNSRTRSFVRPFLWLTKDFPFSYLNAVDKRKYNRKVVEQINKLGNSFNPKKLPYNDANE